MGKKVYAVRNGRQTGIFDSWSECQKQVTGYSGAEFKGFATREEAMVFLGRQGSQLSEEYFEKGSNLIGKKGNQEIKEFSLNSKDILSAVAYVDGSYDKLSGDFSYGMVILYQGEELKFFERIHNEELAQMHNVAGEIKGAEAAMRYAISHHLKKIVICHDYEGIAKWCNGTWKANKEGTKAYKAYYESICDQLEVEFVKVKGHSNDKYNDMADELAKQALGIG